MINVGVYKPKDLPESFRVCVDNICSHLVSQGCQPVMTDDTNTLTSCDVIWDPRAGGGNAPLDLLINLNKPLVITLHGIGPIIYPSLYSMGVRHKLTVLFANLKKKLKWRKQLKHCYKVVTVSEFSKTVITKYLPIPKDKVEVVYNGFDDTIFNQSFKSESKAPYFLHISNDEPRKNVSLIIEAYESLNTDNKWPLKLKLSGSRVVNTPGIELITERLSDEQISALYQQAGAFIFPSIYEGFGIPIVEALACGCPVVTSRDTACEEVGKNTVLLVDPYSKKEISDAMQTVMDTEDKCTLMKGASDLLTSYSWKTAAEEYAQLFKGAFDESQQDSSKIT